MAEFQHRMCEFSCPNDKQPIFFVNLKERNNLGNRVWCRKCKTISNPTQLEEFYKMVKRIPVIPLQQQLIVIEGKIERFQEMKKKVVDEIFSKFDSIEQKCLEVLKIFQQQYQAFDIDNQDFDVNKLSLLAHFLSGDGISDLERNIKELREEEKLFFDNFCESLVSLSKKIMSRNEVEQVRQPSVFELSKKQWAMFNTLLCPVDVYALACSNDGKQFIAGGLPIEEFQNESTLIHYFDRYEQLRSELYGAHLMTVTHALMTNDNIIITASKDNSIREGFKKPGASYFQFQIYMQHATSLFLNKNEDILLTGQIDGSIVIWRREGFQQEFMSAKAWVPKETLQNHAEPITLLKMNNESKFLFSGSDTNELQIWENRFDKWRVMQILQLSEIVQSLCCIAPEQILLGTNTGMVYLFLLDKLTSRFIRKFSLPSFGTAVKEIIYNEMVLILTLDKFVIFEKQDIERYVEIFRQEGNYSCVCFAKNAQLIAAYQSSKKELQLFKVFGPEMEVSKNLTRSIINPSGKSYVESRIVFQK